MEGEKTSKNRWWRFSGGFEERNNIMENDISEKSVWGHVEDRLDCSGPKARSLASELIRGTGSVERKGPILEAWC